LIIADGSQLPFTDNTFDAALLIGVLHHMPTQLHVLVLQEGLRVLRAGGRLLVLEDTYHGNRERFATYVIDSVMNFEFIGHPHSNRSSEEWGNIMREIRGHLVHNRKYISWYGPFRFRHALFVIEKVAG
jgi:Methylase involved in ubiquinone/menaquinone biosynthesis